MQSQCYFWVVVPQGLGEGGASYWFSGRRRQHKKTIRGCPVTDPLITLLCFVFPDTHIHYLNEYHYHLIKCGLLIMSHKPDPVFNHEHWGILQRLHFYMHLVCSRLCCCCHKYEHAWSWSWTWQRLTKQSTLMFVHQSAHMLSNGSTETSLLLL